MRKIRDFFAADVDDEPADSFKLRSDLPLPACCEQEHRVIAKIEAKQSRRGFFVRTVISHSSGTRASEPLLQRLPNTMKSQQNCVPSPNPRQAFLQWLTSPGVGQMLHELEAAFLLNHLKLTYNQTILQVGSLGHGNHFIQQEFRRNYVLVDTFIQVSNPDLPTAQTDPRDLPFASNSIDIIVLPHFLEFEPNPHAVLQEVERVLKPEGELFIFGFNPWRLRSVMKSAAAEAFDVPNAVSSHRLNDWLSLLKLQAETLAGFYPTSSETIARPSDLLGQSKAIFATAYLVRAIKHTYTLIPVKPIWLRASALLPRRAIDTAIVRRS